jgi:hypothetical protein
MIHGHLLRLLDADAQVREATKVVRFEDLCAAPAEAIRAVLDHCALPDGERVVTRLAAAIRSPDYYPSPLSSAELALIREETAATTQELFQQ